MELKSEMGVPKQFFVSQLGNMQMVFVSKTKKHAHRSRRRHCCIGDFPTFDFDDFSKLLKSCKLKVLKSFICEKIQLSIILVSVPV